MTQPPDAEGTIYSVGHSNHSLAHFLALPAKWRIEVLVDVRSRPYSRYCPHFCRDALAAAVRSAGLQYLHLGDQLGGMPDDDRFRDQRGKIDYRRVAADPRFVRGLDRLIAGATRHRTAMMCAEEDPLRCHRYHLITTALRNRGVTVVHIRGDGRLESDDDVAARDPASADRQLSLF